MARLAEWMNDGGPVMWLLAALSVLSVSLILWKIFELRGVTAGRKRREQALADWGAGRRDAALSALSSGTAPADRVTVRAVDLVSQGVPLPLVEAELTRTGNDEVAAMSRHLRLLELIAMVSPLLGLLGTVLGMIQSFQELAAAEGSANASVLAGGIWQALLTTAAGLVVAIPAAVAAGLLAGRVEAGAREIEGSAGRLLMLEGAPRRAA